MNENTCQHEGCSVVWHSYRPRDYCQDHRSREALGEKLERIEHSESQRLIYTRNHSGKKWEKARKQALERYDRECANCGITHYEHKQRSDLWGKGLHVHHITPAREFDDPDDAHEVENLIPLCDSCHHEAESGRLNVEKLRNGVEQ